MFWHHFCASGFLTASAHRLIYGNAFNPCAGVNRRSQEVSYSTAAAAETVYNGKVIKFTTGDGNPKMLN